jgi:predicted DCC family thiol-disulfide oxidoreductase YuxK
MTSSTPWDFKLLFDGDCPLCKREVGMLERLNKRGRLALEDIAAPDFEPARYGRTYAELMGQIHGVLPDGSLVTGTEVFRRAYAAVGLGALAAPTGWPVLRPMFDLAYRVFAKNRLRLTGRSEACAEGRCAVPSK